MPRLKIAKLHMHRDLVSFTFGVSSAAARLIKELSNPAFTGAAQHVVFICGSGAGKRK
ncbi:ATP-binding protein [Pseudomonas asiatica]|uniref:ATP-binding protein n=1 Tax=Pseudomonas asiatica TaxID=2219225 RepID=UPI00383A981D